LLEKERQPGLSVKNDQAAPATAGEPPLSERLKQKIKDGVIAASAANLCFVTAWFNSLYDKDSYFNKLPIGTPTLLALLENILWLAALVWVVIRFRRRAQNRLSKLVMDLLFIGLLLVPINFVRYDIFQIWDYQLIAFFKQPVVLFCAAVVFAVAVAAHEHAARLARMVMAIFSPLAVLVWGKSILLLLGVIHLEQQLNPPALPAPVAVPGGQPRVLWVIFDTSDYRIIFEERPPGVRMPEFDRLRDQSISAVNAVSPAGNTLWSMPALISGQRLSHVKISGLSDLKVKVAATGEATTWKKLPSVFAEARSLGVNTALVGWFHPYSRVLGDGLNYCSWYPFPAYEPDRAATFTESMREQIGCLMFTPHVRHIFLNTCLNSLQDSISVATNKTYGLVLLHLPPPHTPGVYIASENRFTYWPMTRNAGYFNNLALADLELGRIRGAMEDAGTWDKTWVILSADHSWAGSQTYDGKVDPRVPFLIKPPGAGFGTSYSSPFNTVLTHDLILAILRGELTNGENVVAWIDRHGKSVPTIVPVDGGSQ
jgi:Sulfatase